jgi:hypothetical protein
LVEFDHRGCFYVRMKETAESTRFLPSDRLGYAGIS